MQHIVSYSLVGELSLASAMAIGVLAAVVAVLYAIDHKGVDRPKTSRLTWLVAALAALFFLGDLIGVLLPGIQFYRVEFCSEAAEYRGCPPAEPGAFIRGNASAMRVELTSEEIEILLEGLDYYKTKIAFQKGGGSYAEKTARLGEADAIAAKLRGAAGSGRGGDCSSEGTGG